MPDGPESCIDKSKRLEADDTFCFSCTPEKKCFTQCCYDINLVLMPYDILRLKNRLGITSGEFLQRHTSVHVGPTSGLPVVLLKLEGPYQKCPFLDQESGCTVYEDRPGACRTYPLARVACRGKDREGVEEFYYLVKEPDCLGFRDGKSWTVREWREREGVRPYDEMNDLFGELLQAKAEAGGPSLNADQIEICYMGCYDIDGFREFFLNSPNLERYMETEEVVQELSRDEEALLRYGIRWVRKKLFLGGLFACGASCGIS